MKRLWISVAALTFVLAVTAAVSARIAQPKGEHTIASRWATKEKSKPSQATWFNRSPEEWGEITDLATISTMFGFDVKMPKDARASQAGEPKVYVYKGVVELVRSKGRAPKPTSRQTGEGSRVIYPNGFEFAIHQRNPQDPTKNYPRFVEQENKDTTKWIEKGYLDGQLFELTAVNGFRGYQIENGFNYMGGLGTDDPSDKSLREPRKAVVVWYDDEKEVEYTAYAPIGVSLKELREVVDSIY